jgi:hypothetical protein
MRLRAPCSARNWTKPVERLSPTELSQGALLFVLARVLVLSICVGLRRPECTRVMLLAVELEVLAVIEWPWG